MLISKYWGFFQLLSDTDLCSKFDSVQRTHSYKILSPIKFWDLFWDLEYGLLWIYYFICTCSECTCCCCQNVLQMLTRSSCLTVLYTYFIFLLIFCLLSINYLEHSLELSSYNWECIYLFFQLKIPSFLFHVWCHSVTGCKHSELNISSWWIKPFIIMKSPPNLW